jgi:hypothetical protein
VTQKGYELNKYSNFKFANQLHDYCAYPHPSASSFAPVDVISQIE